jgi:hypothetical protein
MFYDLVGLGEVNKVIIYPPAWNCHLLNTQSKHETRRNLNKQDGDDSKVKGQTSRIEVMTRLCWCDGVPLIAYTRHEKFRAGAKHEMVESSMRRMRTNDLGQGIHWRHSGIARG